MVNSNISGHIGQEARTYFKSLENYIIMAFGLFIWIVLIIVLLGGFEALAFIASSMVATFIIGLIMASNRQKTSENGK